MCRTWVGRVGAAALKVPDSIRGTESGQGVAVLLAGLGLLTVRMRS